MKNILKELIKGYQLTKSEAHDLILAILDGAYSDIQVAAILSHYEARCPSQDEFIGFRNGLMSLSKKISFPSYKTLDICGTGGDGKDTFNISTTAAFVLAAGGVKVAKHGNYGSGG